MSLAIDIDEVSEVLLADGWHTVLDDSFYVDAYEMIGDQGDTFRDVRIDYSGGNGFAFKEPQKGGGTTYTYGPISSIIAVRTQKKK